MLCIHVHVNSLSSTPALNKPSVLTSSSLKEELPAYLAKASDVLLLSMNLNSGDTMKMFLPAWSKLQKLLQPSSAAAERTFSSKQIH